MGFGKSKWLNLPFLKYIFFNEVIKKIFPTVIIFLCLFQTQRLLLLITNIKDFEGVPSEFIFLSFVVGLRFDLSITLYIVSLIFIVYFILYFLKIEKYLNHIAFTYFSLMSFLVIFLFSVEIEFYRFFKSRLNFYVMNVKTSPRTIIKMIWEMYPVTLYLLIIALLTAICIYLFRKIYLNAKSSESIPFGFKLTSFLIFSILIFIGIRGTLSPKTPLRWGHAYFCNFNSCNKLALNGIFTLFDEILKKPTTTEEIQKLFNTNEDEAKKIIERYLIQDNSQFIHFPLRKYSNDTQNLRKYNLVIFILESFSKARINQYKNQNKRLFFLELEKKGITFENIYSNGMHTNMGLFSTLFGLPNLIGKNIMAINLGQQTFSGIPNILSELGYEVYFGVSHDPNFDNMAGFLTSNGVSKIISQFDFPQNLVLSSLGVPDHLLFERMHQLFESSKKPFCGIILSTNNHGPWKIPKVAGKNFGSTFEYTDWAVEHFFEFAKKAKYFDNTIFVITADHSLIENPKYELDLNAFHIPLLIFLPSSDIHQTIETFGSQIDIPNTILNFMQIDYETTNLGRNLFALNDSSLSFALINEGKTLGLITKDWFLIHRLGSKTSLFKQNSNDYQTNYAEINQDTLQLLKDILISFYYYSNKSMIERKVKQKN